MDDDTIVEAFKFLNYYQVAKNCLVSKRFQTLIQTHKHFLALLFVDEITMKRISLHGPAYINVLDQKLSPEDYNEWVNCNQYSKQVPLEDQVAVTDSSHLDYNGYELSTYAVYNDSNRRKRLDRTTVFKAGAELNEENWPLFQHFVRLITDSFIYIRWLDLIPQNDVFNLLAEAVNLHRDRFKCGKLRFNLEGNCQEFINWIKNNVRCDQFQIIDRWGMPRYDVGLLDFFLSGARCTSKIYMEYYDPSYVIVEFAQKFMDLKSSDEYQVVQLMDCNVAKICIKELKRECANFIVEERYDNGTTKHTFVFVNNDIGKKLEITAKIFEEPTDIIDSDIITPFDRYESYLELQIQNIRDANLSLFADSAAEISDVDRPSRSASAAVPKPIKRKRSSQRELPESPTMAESSTNLNRKLELALDKAMDVETESDQFGRMVALKLKKFSAINRVIAQEEIQAVLKRIEFSDMGHDQTTS